MRARVLFFGMLKDIAGSPSEDAIFPEGADLHAVFDAYAARFPRMRELASSIVVARNHEFSDLTTKVADGDEIAFLPPVSGGSECDVIDDSGDGHLFALTRNTIDPRLWIARLQNGSEGAVVTFEGVVRNNTKGRPTLCLDYDCYEPMALKLMGKIGREIAGSYAVGRVAIIHRLGRMLVGEASVVIIVTAPHRRPAFEAALEAIDRLKKTVPIWKKEHFVDGEVWVEGEWDHEAPKAG
jgi:molybdopterin synthase catalytic subunit